MFFNVYDRLHLLLQGSFQPLEKVGFRWQSFDLAAIPQPSQGVYWTGAPIPRVGESHVKLDCCTSLTETV